MLDASRPKGRIFKCSFLPSLRPLVSSEADNPPRNKEFLGDRISEQSFLTECPGRHLDLVLDSDRKRS